MGALIPRLMINTQSFRHTTSGVFVVTGNHVEFHATKSLRAFKKNERRLWKISNSNVEVDRKSPSF
jgi:hypothetical protein